MEIFSLKLDDDWWMTIFRWLSLVAIALSFAATAALHYFASRATRAMKNEIAQSTQRTEEFKKENLELGIKLEQERKARLEIQRQIADRVLTQEERRLILGAISPFPGQEIQIYAVHGDGEPARYADQIIAALEAAKWKVTTIQGALLGSPGYGLLIRTRSKPTKAIQSLIDGLENAKLPLQTQVVPTLATLNAIEAELTVGLKERR